MSGQQDPWNTQQRPLGQQFNRQHPPVLPPPATLETGGQPFYPLPSLPSLGNGTGHPEQHGFNIPAINTGTEPMREVLTRMQQAEQTRAELRRPSNTALGSSTQLPPPAVIAAGLEQLNAPPMSQGVPNRSTITNVYRPLNVKDALSYLDQVKIQFYNQADVYNNFLDIMKDFKSQSIDTPGVIDRVSTLFKGHPNLIQGFNTFLPPGYRIECSLDPSDPNPIRVTTPTGTTTRPNMGYNQGWNSNSSQEQSQIKHSQTSQQLGGSPPAPFMPSIPDQQAQQLQQLQQQQQQQAGGQIEFNHAISYVNKIKTRFANQPDIYKQFLEILQTYQREQKPIGEVYEQVTVLFSESPDLLDDFKQFLPDTGNQGYLQQRQVTDSGFYPQGNGTSQLPPVGNFQPPTGSTGLSPNGAQSQYQQQQQQGYLGPGLSGTQEALSQVTADHSLGNRKKRSSVSEQVGYDSTYVPEGQFSNLRTQSNGKSISGPAKNGHVVTNPSLVPGVPEPVPPSDSMKVSSLLEEISFFDKVKKAIGNKQTYSEFLKILNLYSQDIIDKETLVERVDSFIGDNHPNLLQWFKMFVGYEPKTQSIESITFKKHQLELSLCKAYGPSYRQLPKAETYMPCSGRDEMCWEVLNDEWVGHPTWASEDSGFVAHRKNQYEEILFKIEEERHEFDYIMESNLRTIQTLETIANRIANMTPEQKASFKLPPGLGSSATIYKKVVRKVYDKDRGFEVIEALHENPAIAVPIVLKRLKQKDEEWKRSHREWNKVWREMEQKVFYKSLDHLGLTFKQADKKLLTAKQLVSEISTVKLEQQNKRLHPLTPKPQEQLNYAFKDKDIFLGIFRLADVFINRSSNYSVSDREKLIQFFKFFLSRFFSISSEEIEKAVSSKQDNGVELQDIENDVSERQDGSTGTKRDSQSRKRHHENDLLKDVLKKQSKSKKDDSNDSPSQASSDQEDQELSEFVGKSSELWIKPTSSNYNMNQTNESGTSERRNKFNLFCNTIIYVFFRHLRTLYERFEEIKGMNAEVAKEIRSRKIPQFAIDLNLVSHKLEDLEIEISGEKDCYDQVLKLSEKLIDGELEHQWFEEALRQGYRNKAYKLYTVDKVVQAMVKHLHTIMTDSKTSEMMVLFDADRNNLVSTAKDQILYRMQVRSLMNNDENMFKITFNEGDGSVNIQFVSLDDLTINDHQSAEEAYNYYVTSYVMYHPTEGVPASRINMPFLKSFIESVDEELCDGHVSTGLKVSICENSYRLFFEADTHDEFTSNTVYNKQAEESKSKADKVSALKSLIESDEVGWKLTLNEDEKPEILEERCNILFTKGAQAYKEAVKEAEKTNMEVEKNKADIINFNDPANVVEQKPITEQENNSEAIPLPRKNPDLTVDGDSTVVQENNDTTIQQEGNDTTADDTTVNNDDVDMLPEHNDN